jgi:AraC-like DNA-binding protein
VKVIGIFFRVDAAMFIQLVSLAIYHAMAYRCWQKHKHSLKSYFSETQRLQMNWLRQFIIASLIVCSIISIAIYLVYVNNPQSRPFRSLFAVLSVFIYWVSYTALTKPSVFSIVKGYAGRDNTVLPVLPALVVHRPARKYSNSGLTEEDKGQILSGLHKEMMAQKPYLNPELTISDLADMIKCNRHHLSQALNESMNQSFYDYINFYRVEEAKQLLIDPLREEHKISSIAYDAGFNSLSTFNDVFKKLTGVTPSQYKKRPGPVSKQIRG